MVKQYYKICAFNEHKSETAYPNIDITRENRICITEYSTY